MTTPPTAARQSFGDIAPKLAALSDALVERVTHLAFHAGWPNAMSAVTKMRELGLAATKE